MLMILRIHPNNSVLLSNVDLSHIRCDMVSEGNLALIMSNILIFARRSQRRQAQYV